MATGCCATACRTLRRRRGNPLGGDRGRHRGRARSVPQKCEVCHGYDGSGRPRSAPANIRVRRRCARSAPSHVGRRDLLPHPQRHPEHRHAGLEHAGPADLAAGRLYPQSADTVPMSGRLSECVPSRHFARAACHGRGNRPASDAHYVGSAACKTCHAAIYERWKKTPMANVVRDPQRASRRDHSRSLQARSAGHVHQGRHRVRLRQQVEAALLHEGRRRLFPAARAVGRHAQDLARRISSRTAPTGGCRSIPPDNMQRPTGPLCDGCHSVNYDIADQDRSPNGTSAARSATARAASTCAQADARQHRQSGAARLRAAPTTPASSATRRDSR